MEQKLNQMIIGRLVAVLVALVLVSSFVIALEEVEIDSAMNDAVLTEVDASLEEDVGAFKIAFKRVGAWLTLNPERRIDKELDLARLRLIQAKVAASNGDEFAMEKAIQAHEKAVQRVGERMEQVRVSRAGAEEDFEREVGLERAIQVHSLRIERINELLENENLSDEQKERISQAMERTRTSVEVLKSVQERRMEQVQTRAMAEYGLSATEVEQKMNQIQERERIQELEEITSQKREEVQIRIDERVERTEGRGNQIR